MQFHNLLFYFLFSYGDQMTYLTDHATQNGRILSFNYLIHSLDAKCIQRSFLVFGSTNTALYLLYFNCCHCCYPFINL